MQKLSALILTYNEEANIGRLLGQLEDLETVVVVDSFSTDATLDIIKGFPNTRVLQREFDTHTNQWNFGLDHLKRETEWVLALDADYDVSEVIQEILSLDLVTETDAFWGAFNYSINGNIVRCGIYPPVQVLYRAKKAQYVDDGHTQRIKVDGSSAWLDNKLIHDDRKSMDRWLLSQRKYAKLEAEKLSTTEQHQLSSRDKMRKASFFTPVIVFLYILIIKRGILDGKNGIIYAFQRLIAESILQIQLRDK